MNIASLGEVIIMIRKTDTPDIVQVSVQAENKAEFVENVTRAGESIDIFTKRLNGMLRAVYNAEPRKASPASDKTEPVVETEAQEAKRSTWNEVKKRVGLQ